MKNDKLECELNRIHHSRNRLGYLPALLAFLVSSYFQKESLPFDIRWTIAVSFLTLGTIVRVWVGELLFDKWSRKVPWVRFLNLSSFVLIGLGWGLHFSDVYFHYGAASQNVFYTLMIISAFIIGSSTSLVAYRSGFLTFVLTLSGGVILTFLLGQRLEQSYIILNILIFLAFSFSSYRLAHEQLCNLILAQHQSEAEKDQLRHIINTVPGLVALIDSNRICYLANETTLTFYPEIIGKKLGSLDANSHWEQFVLDFMASDKLNDVSEQHTVFQGRDIYTILNVQKLRDGGVIMASIITTELVEAQKKLREQEAKAQYAARLASLGQMAASIAHEINNPLTIIQGSAGIIGRLISSDPMDRELIQTLSDKVVNTTERISKTIKGLKSLSRDGENDPMVPVSIRRVLDLCFEISLQRFSQTNVKLKHASDIPGVSILGREVQLAQVFMNLLGNSIDAVKGQSSPWVEVRVECKESVVEVWIIDSGAGIPEKIQEKIMEPFFTTKDVNEGTGLGLSISKTIMQEHGGELILLPNEKNTTFVVKLPVI